MTTLADRVAQFFYFMHDDRMTLLSSFSQQRDPRVSLCSAPFHLPPLLPPFLLPSVFDDVELCEYHVDIVSSSVLPAPALLLLVAMRNFPEDDLLFLSPAYPTMPRRQGRSIAVEHFFLILYMPVQLRLMDS